MYWTHKLPLKILLRMKRWKRKPRASAWNNKAFVTSCRTSGVRKMAQCAPPPGTSTVFLHPQWLQHKLKSSQKVSKYPRLERERPCPSRCANEELHLHQCVGGYSSGATYRRWFCRCTCPKPHFLQMLVAVAVSISQAALGWYGDCDGSRHLPREAAADHARESLSLLGMANQCAMQTHGMQIVLLSANRNHEMLLICLKEEQLQTKASKLQLGWLIITCFSTPRVQRCRQAWAATRSHVHFQHSVFSWFVSLLLGS